MAKKKTDEPKVYKEHPSVDQRITDTLRENYMPYAMSVIVSRAIPEIDGFKPSHRKLLYTMYKMGLLNGSRTKSANIVGQTMKLNPHGDAGHLRHDGAPAARQRSAAARRSWTPRATSARSYSRDMAYAAPRYTEAKLDAICAELFRDIDTDTVDFVDNYDGDDEGADPAADHLPEYPRHRRTPASRSAWRPASAASTSARCAARPSPISKTRTHDLLGHPARAGFPNRRRADLRRRARCAPSTPPAAAAFKVRAKWRL